MNNYIYTFNDYITNDTYLSLKERLKEIEFKKDKTKNKYWFYLNSFGGEVHIVLPLFLLIKEKFDCLIGGILFSSSGELWLRWNKETRYAIQFETIFSLHRIVQPIPNNSNFNQIHSGKISDHLKILDKNLINLLANNLYIETPSKYSKQYNDLQYQAKEIIEQEKVYDTLELINDNLLSQENNIPVYELEKFINI